MTKKSIKPRDDDTKKKKPKIKTKDIKFLDGKFSNNKNTNSRATSEEEKKKSIALGILNSIPKEVSESEILKISKEEDEDYFLLLFTMTISDMKIYKLNNNDNMILCSHA